MGLARNTTSGEKRERQSLAAFAMVASCAVSPGDAFATQTTLPLQMRLYCGEFQLNVSSDEPLWRTLIPLSCFVPSFVFALLATFRYSRCGPLLFVMALVGRYFRPASFLPFFPSFNLSFLFCFALMFEPPSDYKTIPVHLKNQMKQARCRYVWCLSVPPSTFSLLPRRIAYFIFPKCV